MVVVNGDLWIANKDIGGVTVVDLTTGQISIVIVIVHPIGMHYDRKVGKVFVGSKRSHWGGAVFAIDPGTMKVPSEVIRCGMVWYDMVWYGIVWCGMVWCDMV
jgi:hypothetical protein